MRPFLVLLVIATASSCLPAVAAFTNPSQISASSLMRVRPLLAASSKSSNSDSKPASSSSSDDDTANPVSVTIQTVVRDNYPSFYKLLSKNEGIWTTLLQDCADTGVTLFCPTEEAFASKLSDKQRAQLKDPRNLETAQKMGQYHVVNDDAVSLEQLKREDWTVPKDPETGLPALKVGGIKTLGGSVPIGRKVKKSGPFGLGSLFDKDSSEPVKTTVVLGPSAKIVATIKVGNCIVHEVDDLVSPVILWRYCDQLRIPGF